MSKRIMEVMVGLFMVIGALAFFFLSLKVSGLSPVMGETPYTITAHFDNVAGLKVGAPVRVAGVRVGAVQRILLDAKTYRAQVFLRIDQGQQFPTDTAAKILTEGLLGAHYISLTPGYEPAVLAPGAEIQETHSALILEDMIGHFLFSMKGGASKKTGK